MMVGMITLSLGLAQFPPYARASTVPAPCQGLHVYPIAWGADLQCPPPTLLCQTPIEGHVLRGPYASQGFSTTTSDRTYGKGQTRQRYGMCTSTKQEDVRADHPAYHVRQLWSTSARPLAARPKRLGTGPLTPVPMLLVR